MRKLLLFFFALLTSVSGAWAESKISKAVVGTYLFDSSNPVLTINKEGSATITNSEGAIVIHHDNLSTVGKGANNYDRTYAAVVMKVDMPTTAPGSFSQFINLKASSSNSGSIGLGVTSAGKLKGTWGGSEWTSGGGVETASAVTGEQHTIVLLCNDSGTTIYVDDANTSANKSGLKSSTKWTDLRIESAYASCVKSVYVFSGEQNGNIATFFSELSNVVTVANGETESVSGNSTPTRFFVASGGTVTVDAAYDIDKIEGAGDVTLAYNTSLSGGISTVATGKLTISEDKTLTLGTGQGQTNSIASFTSIELSGTIKHNNSVATLNNVTVPADKTGKIFAYDMGSTSDGFKLAGTTTLTGNLVVCSKYNFQMKVDALAGSGDCLICGTTGDNYDASGTSSNEAATINIANASSYTGGVTVNNSNATVNLSGNLVGSSWTKTNGTLNYKGKTDAEPTLNGTTLSGVILAGSYRLKITGSITIENLAGNNQTTGSNTYAFYTAGSGTVTLKGTCDFTKKSDNTDATATYIGVANDNALAIANNANVKVKCLYGSTTLSKNANWTIGSGATLEVTSSSYAPSVTNNGILTLGNTLSTNGLTLNEGSRINTGSNITGAITVSGNATLHQTSATLSLTPTITIASGKTLTYDGTDVVNATLSNALNVTGDGTLNVTNCTFGSDRDLSNINCSLTPTTGIVFVETSDEFLHNNDLTGVTINNIPDGVTKVTLKRADRTYVELDVASNTATFTDNTQKVSGPACLYDFTFSDETLAERKVEDTAWILNSGSRGSSNGLKYDTDYNSGNSYNETNGALLAKSTPWRDMKDGNAWPTNYSVAVYANVPDYENGCLMAFGSSTAGGNNYLALIRGASQNEIKLVKGTGTNNAFTEIATMSAENATVAKHLIVFTKSGSTFKVYCDGVNVATTTYDQTLGTGFQIGSVHGGVTGTGIVRINDNNISAAIRDAVEVQAIRIFDGVLTDGQMSALIEEFPYVSRGGAYSREISTDANLGEDDAWTASDETTSHIPSQVVEDASTFNPDVAITTSANATLTVNESATFGKTSFGGSGTLTIAASDGNTLEIGGAVIINSDIVVKFGAMNMSTSPVTKGATANLTFDFSDFDFNKVYTTTKYQLTGLIDQDDTHITATGLPTADATRTAYTFEYDDNHYWLTVTVRDPQNVYLPSATTDITDDMAVKLTNDAATNNGLLIQGDNLIINNTGTLLFKETSGFCTFDIQNGATVTVNNRTTGGYALDGENITITNGTLKLNNNNDTDDAKINSATITIGENGTLDNYGWLTVDGTLTVNSNYDKTILNNSGGQNPSQTRGTGKIVKGGTGIITMKALPNCTENSTVHPIEITAGTLILNNNAQTGAITGSGTLNVPTATSISVASIAAGTTLTGSGNVTLTSFPSATAPTLTSWTGAIEFPATSAGQGNLTTLFNAWGNVNSTIKLNNINGYFHAVSPSDLPSDAATVKPTLNILSGATLTSNDGYSDKTAVLTKVTGAGILETLQGSSATYTINIATLNNDFTGTLKGTYRPIVVEKFVLDDEPYVNDRLIKTSGTVTLETLYVGSLKTTALTWETKTVEDVKGIYVTAFDQVQLRRDMAEDVVSPYKDYIGTGAGKYTISLSGSDYNTMSDFRTAIAAWTTTEDYVVPTVAINQPTSGFYRFKAAERSASDNTNNWYMGGNADGIYSASTTDAQASDANTIFYLEKDGDGYHPINYVSGLYSNGTANNAVGTKSNFTLTQAIKANDTDLLYGEYKLVNTGTSKTIVMWSNSTLNAIDGNNDWSGWTIEEVESLPVTIGSSGYATLYSPVALEVPEGVTAFWGENSAVDNAILVHAIKTGEVIPANNGVVLYTTAPNTYDFDITTEPGSISGTNVITGTVTTKDRSGEYTLQIPKEGEDKTPAFFGDGPTYLQGFKAYLPSGSSSYVMQLIFDEETVVKAIEAAMNPGKVVYDMNGRRVENPSKGLYIVNGKKVIIK